MKIIIETDSEKMTVKIENPTKDEICTEEKRWWDKYDITSEWGGV
tara:strand:+ start:344 stop:478 length:135 start_codon:yes stop_codon:yes gene_type:complete